MSFFLQVFSLAIFAISVGCLAFQEYTAATWLVGAAIYLKMSAINLSGPGQNQ